MNDRRRHLVDLTRSVGGLLFAIGSIVLLTRQSGSGGWSDFARMLIGVVPAVALYLIAVVAPPTGEADDERPWRAVLSVSSILLAPVATLQLLHWLGADIGAELWLAAVFALTTLLAAYAMKRTHAPYLAFLAALSALATWLFLWEQIAEPSGEVARWLLIAAAALLLGVAAWLARAGATGWREVATVGGFAAVLPGIIGVFVSYLATFANGLLSGGDLVGSPLHGPGKLSGAETFGWDVYLLLVAVSLVWLGSQMRSRGLGYVGGLGVVTFVIGVGAQLTRLAAGRPAQTGVGGWPIALIVIGGAVLLLPVLLRREP